MLIERRLGRLDSMKAKWQDIVMMSAGFVFAPSLIASIASGANIPLATSLPTVLALLAITVSTASLRLYLTTIANVLTAICWLILVFVGG